MTTSPIFNTRKLEKTIIGFISKETQEVEEINDYLGGWVANLFHVNHKKCWILINQKTKYILVFPDVRKPDINDISNVFKEAFYAQLIYDGIIIDYNFVKFCFEGHFFRCFVNARFDGFQIIRSASD